MKKLIIASAIILGLAVAIGAIFLFVKLLRPKVSGLAVESTPASVVYINGQKVGNTPYSSKDMSPGEVSVRLIPIDSQTAFAPFDTKLNLAAGIETVLRREFSQNEESSSTELLSFEKINEKESSISVMKEGEGRVLPKVLEKCKKCGNPQAYFWTVQTRSGDEAETKFFKCVKCTHTWREYR